MSVHFWHGTAGVALLCLVSALNACKRAFSFEALQAHHVLRSHLSMRTKRRSAPERTGNGF